MRHKKITHAYVASLLPKEGTFTCAEFAEQSGLTLSFVIQRLRDYHVLGLIARSRRQTAAGYLYSAIEHKLPAIAAMDADHPPRSLSAIGYSDIDKLVFCTPWL